MSVADLAGAQLLARGARPALKKPRSSMSASVPVAIRADGLALAEDAVDDADVGDDAAVLVEFL